MKPKGRAGKRLTLELKSEAHAKMKTLQNDTGAASITEVIKRALAVYEYVHDTKKSGGAIIVRDATGKETEIILL